MSETAKTVETPTHEQQLADVRKHLADSRKSLRKALAVALLPGATLDLDLFHDVLSADPVLRRAEESFAPPVGFEGVPAPASA